MIMMARPNIARAAMSIFSANVVRLCQEEWEFFDRGKRKEYQNKVFRRVGTYWRHGLNIPRRNGRTGVNFGDLDPDDPNVIVPASRNKNPKWSAAFISWVARNAGAGEAFHYSSFHSRYILAALRAAGNPKSKEKFIARRHTGTTPRLGDLIACGRSTAKDATFDTAECFWSERRKDFFPSHTDFVVEVDVAGRFVRTIGGNVRNTVGRKRWPLDSRGHIRDNDPLAPTHNVICIIRCLLP
jgi:hypothetical protein